MYRLVRCCWLWDGYVSREWTCKKGVNEGKKSGKGKGKDTNCANTEKRANENRRDGQYVRMDARGHHHRPRLLDHGHPAMAAPKTEHGF